STISAGWAVFWVLIAGVLDGVSFNAGGGITDFEEMSQATAVTIATIDIISIAIVAGLLLHVQANLTRYWNGLPNVRLVSGRIGVGEVIFGLIGAAMWFDTLANLLSPAYRIYALPISLPILHADGHRHHKA
ncbi:MAG: hypothetical protein ACE5I2_15035, partial [Anaerolineae bacterium]